MNFETITLIGLIAVLIVLAILNLLKHGKLRDKFLRFEGLLDNFSASSNKLLEQHEENRLQLFKTLFEFKEQLHKQFTEHRKEFDMHQINNLKVLQESLQKGIGNLREEISATLKRNTETIDKRVEKLTENTELRLKEISGQVDKRLSEGFEKTTATFTDVIKRLALIDAAQKKITELSKNVVDLQEVFSDKRARGAFGEVQMAGLIRNIMPESSFKLQYSLSNGKRADCILFLPAPTGNIVIDAKFPLENFRKMTDLKRSENERKRHEQQFRIDIKKHINDIAEKYIIEGETSNGAVMFIPAEAVFAEIHANFTDLVDIAQRKHVWIVSPTTMMAIVTTARAVLKDEATRKQIHIIQEHLSYLSKDFDRFQQRMDNLARHIDQANEDVKDVNTSARKITSRFGKIEKVELGEAELSALEELE